MPALDLIAWSLVSLWAALLAGGLLWGKPAADGRRLPRWIRMSSSALLCLLAWYGYLLATSPPDTRYALYIALGMTWGLVGDLALAGLLPAGSRLLAGMTAFGFGHIAYILAIVTRGPVSWLPILLWLLAGALLTYWVVWRSARAALLRRAAFVYGLLLAGSAGSAAGLAIATPLFFGLALGTALFVASDLLLAAQRFAGLDLPGIDDLVWLTYGPAQALIVTSTWAALQTFHPG